MVILLKMGELVLKGLNRTNFEKRLLDQVKGRLRPLGGFEVSSRQSTVFIEPLRDDVDMRAATELCTRIFGVVSVATAHTAEKEIGAITGTAVRELKPALSAPCTFKVESKRADKTFPMSSIQISQTVGGALHDAYPHLKVDVDHPQVKVMVEVREKAAYIHASPRPGAGGLPHGMSGRGVLLLSGGIDSPAAGLMMARRGVELIPVHFYSYPYTSREALDKVLELANLMSKWCGPLKVRVVPFTKIQEEIRKNCPEGYFTLIMRRFMMRIADQVAHSRQAGSLITGESLGQVASQTMRALRSTEAVCSVPVLRPCIGMDKEEIVRQARHYGTFETSILPFEDCCTVFTPRHPKTNPKDDEIARIEETMDVEGLVNDALAQVELM